MSDIVPSCQHPPLSAAKGGTTVAQLAHRFNLEIRPAPGQSSEQFAQLLIRTVAPLHRAGPGELSFLAHSRHRASLEQSQASAIVVNAETARDWQGPALISQQPSADFARIAALFEQLPDYAIGIHPTAVVHASARLGPECRIAAGVVIGAGAVIGSSCTIGPGCVIEDEAQVGANTRLVARVSIAHHVELGARCLIHPGVVIGADGFGQAWEQDHWVKVPQLGRVIVGDDVEIGANTTIDRGALDDTIIGNGVRIDNLVQIAHNVRIGDHTAIAACVGIAGSAVIGRYCLIGGAAAILGHIQICDRVIVQGMSSITHSIDTPGEYGSAVAAQEVKLWRRNLARLRSLDKTLRELIQNQRRNQR